MVPVNSVNYLAVLVAAIAGMVVGAVWYSPMLFAKPWMKALGKKSEEMDSMRQMAGKGYVVSAISALVISYILSLFIVTASTASGNTGAALGLSIAFWAWLGFVATTHAIITVFEGRSNNLYFINVGYQLVSFLVMGAILGAWMK